MTGKAKILGTGSSLPPYEYDNEELAKIVQKIHPDAPGKEWSEEVFGIHKRHRSLNYETNTIHEGCSDTELAIKAAKNALDMASLKGKDIDFIIHASSSPDFTVEPDPSLEIHKDLEGKADCGTITLPTACAGMVYGVNMANSFIQSGMAENVLVTASNVFSAYIRQSYFTMYFTGDGAGAVVLGPADEGEESGIIDTYFGVRHDPPGFIFPRSGTAQYSMQHRIPDFSWDADFQAENVATYGHLVLSQTLNGILDRHPGILSKLDCLIVHQANIHLQLFLSQELDLPIEKIPFDIDHVGNAFAASTGILLDEVVREGKIKRGNLVLALAVGTGWTGAAYLMKW